MPYAAPLELMTDAAGSVTFGWVDEGVYYARFSRCLSAKLGEAFATRLGEMVQGHVLSYFGDARALESYDLVARRAFVRVVVEERRTFESLTLLSWSGGEQSSAYIDALGPKVIMAKDAVDFEARLLAAAPAARSKLSPRQEPRQRSRWSLRR